MIYEKVKVFPSNQCYYNKVVTKELISRKIFELDRVLQNAQCGNCRNFLSHIFSQKFRESNGFAKEIAK